MTDTKPGRYYLRTAQGMVEAAAAAGADIDVVICRRVEDVPIGKTLPETMKFGTCSRCRAAIIFDGAGPHQDKPRACMQCCGITPLPY